LQLQYAATVHDEMAGKGMAQYVSQLLGQS